MNAETAEALFRCYRPGKGTDSRTQKAVKFAEQDPELQKKLAAQVEFDKHIFEIIHYIKPPDNLRKKLSDLSAEPRAENAKLRKHVINPAVLTAILGLVLLLGVIGFLVMERMEKFPGRESVEGLLGTAGKMNGMELEQVETTTNNLGDWLYMRGYEGYEIPPEFVSVPVVASRVFRYDSRTVAQAAIEKNNSLLYQFHASEFGVRLPDNGSWVILTRDEWVGAVRQKGDHCFMVVFRGSKGDMQQFLHSLPKK